MAKYLLIILACILGILALMYFVVGSSAVYSEPRPTLKTPHLYGDSQQSISQIKIIAFYFAPKNREETLTKNWHKVLEDALKELAEFHNLQFQGRSEIVYEIYSEPIIGLKDNSFYDTEITQNGNPKGLISVAQEIEARVDFVQPQGAYLVEVIMYEGVGAAGSDNVAFLSNVYLSQTEYQGLGSSILAHEFYHTLGALEGYDILTDISITSDIMGLGRLRPLNKTFLDLQTLKNFGL